MKKFICLVGLIAVTFLPGLAKAHSSGDETVETCNVGIMAEVSNDNGANWYSYDTSDTPSLTGDYVLSVKPGDNIKIRVRVWNEAETQCMFSAQGTKTGFENLEGLAFETFDEDGDDHDLLGVVEPVSVAGNLHQGTATSGYQSVLLSATVKSNAPDDSAIRLSFNVGQVFGPPEITSVPFYQKILNKIIPTALADADGTATTEVRMEVSDSSATSQILPQTGANAIAMFLFGSLLLLGFFFLGRKLWPAVVRK